jgi:uncharacterized damage-inducible protein DinB
MAFTTTASFLDYYARIRYRTRRLVEMIPPDRIEWTHQADKFTLGDLVRHIASIERWMFAENVQGNPSRYSGCGSELAAGYDEVLAYLDRMHSQSLEIFSSLTDEDLRRKCPTPGGIQITTWKWLRSMAEHEIHHRGQIYLMLGMLKVETPPLYGLSAEEVEARSRK